MDLQALTTVLAHDELLADFIPADADIDTGRVNVALIVDGFADLLNLQITQIDIEPNSLSGLEMVQLYAPIPLELDENALAAVLEVLPEVNQAVPLIGFNVHLQEEFIYFRYVMLVPAGEIGLKLVTEATWMAHFALDNFASSLIAIVEK
jgi:hypothetical protein